MNDNTKAIASALWRIYRRSERPRPWVRGGNLPWDDPGFSKRMLREHLDESHGAASRQTAERVKQIDWMWDRLGLQPGRQIVDVTCGPGLYAVELAEKGCQVTGVDFGPASLAYACKLAVDRGVESRCEFVEKDVREMDFGQGIFDAALFLYGQLAVFKVEEAETLLQSLAEAVRPGGMLCVELLSRQKVDRRDSTWWYTDDTGLWGDAPYLHLGERFWLEEEAISIERFQIVHLETGEFTEVTLCDQSYSAEMMTHMMESAGFDSVEVYRAWDGLSLNDAEEWVVYLAKKASA